VVSLSLFEEKKETKKKNPFAFDVITVKKRKATSSVTRDAVDAFCATHDETVRL
jgi:hypothetical protein